jgi:hypothetical protein
VWLLEGCYAGCACLGKAWGDDGRGIYSPDNEELYCFDEIQLIK